MIRLFSLALLTVLASSAIAAQSPYETVRQQQVVEISILRSLSPESNGVADLLPAIEADKLVLTYTLQNTGKRAAAISRAQLDSVKNCAAVITLAPASHVAAGESTTMVIEIAPQPGGPLSFNVEMALNGRVHAFAVQATVTALLHPGHDHNGRGHCSTGEATSWLLLVGLAAIVAPVLLRRRGA